MRLEVRRESVDDGRRGRARRDTVFEHQSGRRRGIDAGRVTEAHLRHDGSDAVGEVVQREDWEHRHVHVVVAKRKLLRERQLLACQYVVRPVGGFRGVARSAREADQRCIGRRYRVDLPVAGGGFDLPKGEPGGNAPQPTARGDGQRNLP